MFAIQYLQNGLILGFLMASAALPGSVVSCPQSNQEVGEGLEAPGNPIGSGQIGFSYDGLLFRDQEIFFTAVNEIGHVYATLFAHDTNDMDRVFPPNPEYDELFGEINDGWPQHSINKLPAGIFKFRAVLSTGRVLIEVPGIEVFEDGYQTTHPKILDMHFGEQDLVTVAVVKSADDPYDLLAYPDQAISIVYESPTGFVKDDRWLLSPEGLQFPRSMVSKKHWLLITGYRPFLLSDVKGLQSISLRPSLRSYLSINPPNDWPEGIRYGLKFIPADGEGTLAGEQMKMIHRAEDWEAKRDIIFFPAPGEYVLEWSLVDQERFIDEPIYLWSLREDSINLDPAFPDRSLNIPFPAELLAKAKEMAPALLQARADRPTPVIEMDEAALPPRGNDE
jgi:hypothetical protein